MEHQADVHPQLRLILPDAGPGCEKNGRRATWPVTTRSGRHQVPVAVLPTAKSLSAFSLKPQSDRLLGVYVTVLAAGFTNTAVLDKFGLDPKTMPMKPMSVEQCVSEGLSDISDEGEVKNECQ